MPDFSNRLRDLRIEYSLTQKQLANKLNVSQNAIYNWENGKREPDFETLEFLADIFNVDIDYLLGRTDKTTKLTHSMTADEKDIAKDMENIRQKLVNGSDGPLSYDGEPIPEDDIELLLGQIELMIRRLKPINKEKYNPNKNKK